MQNSVISLFPGAMGLDLGFDLEGFDIKAAVENDPWAAKTIQANKGRLSSSPVVISDDVKNVSGNTLLEECALEEGDAAVLIGGPTLRTAFHCR